jgi:hypothetical protein
MSSGRNQPHPEYVEAVEVKMDEALPGLSPILFVHHELRDRRRVVAMIPDLELHKLYVGRLVRVENDDATRPKGLVEAIDGQLALVRYVDWDV